MDETARAKESESVSFMPPPRLKKRTKRQPSDGHADPAPLDTKKRPILDPRQTARYLSVTEAALRLWREKGGGPPWFKAGPRLVRYRSTDLDEWVERRVEKASESR